MRRAEAAQIEGITAGLKAARAGNRTCDIANAFMDVLAKHGISRQGRMGYPIGLSYPPDWGERTASIRTEDLVWLRVNLTLGTLRTALVC
jgi:ectoine hydrolase